MKEELEEPVVEDAALEGEAPEPVLPARWTRAGSTTGDGGGERERRAVAGEAGAVSLFSSADILTSRTLFRNSISLCISSCVISSGTGRSFGSREAGRATQWLVRLRGHARCRPRGEMN